MAEIEIVSSDPNPSNNSEVVPAMAMVVDVYSASAYGDVAKLREFVEKEGLSLSNPDSNGYYALHWAALNNYADIAHYILEHGGDVNAADNMGQRALHWAAVRGSLAAADVLLQNGARVEAVDSNGYRAVHVAAQYGQTTFLNHIIAKYSADLDAVDNDGRSPLHWAAFKGFTDTVRLLLFRDAHQGRQDTEGCTPLHWAAIRGNAEACNLLVHTGTKQELVVKDKAGFTPAQIASDKGHRNVARILSNASKRHGSFCENKLCPQKVGKMEYAPILFSFMVFLMVLFFNSVFAAPNFTKATAAIGFWTCAGLSLGIGSLVMLYRCSSKDPGYVKKNTGGTAILQGFDDSLLNIDLDNLNTRTDIWSLLCPTCKIIRPVRSKHCPSCKHCVEQFDHHCPWISNCVGKRNKWDFFVLVCMGTMTTSIGAGVTIHRMRTGSPIIPLSKTWLHDMMAEHPGAVVFLVLDLFFLLGVFVLTVAQASQIARNITTNEQVNAARYSYLRGPDGKFRNPYNRGIWKNCIEFLIRGHSKDEIAWPSLQQAAR